MERISTGIQGLDVITKGGIPENSLILLSGQSGTGKTISGLQFLFNSNDKGIFVSFEDPIDQIKDTAASFGWKGDNVIFLKYDPFKIEDIFEIVEDNIRKTGARRVVIDSVSALGIYMKDPSDFRRAILQLSIMLRKNKCTSLLISEVVNPKTISRFGMEEFVTDGVIVLHNIFANSEYKRGINVWKMRNTDHSRRMHPYKITEKGIEVFPEDSTDKAGKSHNVQAVGHGK